MKISIYNFSSKNLGLIFFDLGIVLLLSLPILSGFFFLSSSIISLYKNKLTYFKNIWNKYFFSAGIFIIFSSFLLSFRNKEEIISNIDPYNYWIALFNWIPYFFCFWALKPYVKNISQRRRISLLIIIGAIPLIITGMGQYFFNWHGPIILFNGLLTWFQRPIHPTGGLTGLFNNENYAGLWLLIVWPMCLACLKDKYLSKKNKIIFSLISIFIFISALLTRSKMARIELIISYIFTFLNDKIILIFPFLVTFLVLVFFRFTPFLSNQLSTVSTIFASINIFKTQEIITTFTSSARFEIWLIAIKAIFRKPLFGWGATSFPLIYNATRDDVFVAHSHNIFLETALNHGLIVSILLAIPIMSILFSSFKFIFFRRKSKDSAKLNFERAWWIACFTILFSHLVDIQYYDFRVSMIFWILLAGLTCSIEESKNKKFI